MKGIIEVEFETVGGVPFETVEDNPEVRKEFGKNWDKINMLVEKLLLDFYKRYKIKLKMHHKIDITPRKK